MSTAAARCAAQRSLPAPAPTLLQASEASARAAAEHLEQCIRRCLARSEHCECARVRQAVAAAAAAAPAPTSGPPSTQFGNVAGVTLGSSFMNASLSVSDRGGVVSPLDASCSPLLTTSQRRHMIRRRFTGLVGVVTNRLRAEADEALREQMRVSATAELLEAEAKGRRRLAQEEAADTEAAAGRDSLMRVQHFEAVARVALEEKFKRALKAFTTDARHTLRKSFNVVHREVGARSVLPFCRHCGFYYNPTADGRYCTATGVAHVRPTCSLCGLTLNGANTAYCPFTGKPHLLQHALHSGAAGAAGAAAHQGDGPSPGPEMARYLEQFSGAARWPWQPEGKRYADGNKGQKEVVAGGLLYDGLVAAMHAEIRAVVNEQLTLHESTMQPTPSPPHPPPPDPPDHSASPDTPLQPRVAAVS